MKEQCGLGCQFYRHSIPVDHLDGCVQVSLMAGFMTVAINLAINGRQLMSGELANSQSSHTINILLPCPSIIVIGLLLCQLTFNFLY